MGEDHQPKNKSEPTRLQGSFLCLSRVSLATFWELIASTLAWNLNPGVEW